MAVLFATHFFTSDIYYNLLSIGQPHLQKYRYWPLCFASYRLNIILYCHLWSNAREKFQILATILFKYSHGIVQMRTCRQWLKIQVAHDSSFRPFHFAAGAPLIYRNLGFIIASSHSSSAVYTVPYNYSGRVLSLNTHSSAATPAICANWPLFNFDALFATQ